MIRRMPRPLAVLLLLSAIACAPAADVDQLVEELRHQIPTDDLAEPGNTALADAIDELLADKAYVDDDRRALDLHAAEARLLAGDADAATAHAKTVLDDAKATPAERERAGLALVASWQLGLRGAEKPAELPAPLDLVTPYGDLGPKVAARARSAEGERRLALKEPDVAIQRFDEALELLKAEPPAERVPLYSLRLLAMEQAKTDPQAIQKWLEDHAADQAAQQVMDSALTSGQRLVGQTAPPLKAKRLGVDNAEVLSLESYKGKPVLLAFLATWCRPADPVVPVLVAYAAAHPEVQVIGVSLDTKDTVPNLVGYIAKFGITFPIVGDGVGWDSELDDAFHVEGIPHLVIVSPEG